MDLNALIAGLRDRPDLGATDYNEKLKLGGQVADRQLEACRELARRPLRERRLAGEALVSVLPGRPVAGCVPQCCDASWVRVRQLSAKVAALGELQRLGPEAPDMNTELVDLLLAPPGALLALPMARLLGASPALAVRHLGSLEATAAHPRATVVEAVAVALGRSGDGRARRTLVELARDARSPVAMAALRALRALGDDALARAALERAVVHHADERVKYVALKILLGWGGGAGLARPKLERLRGTSHPGLARAVARALGEPFGAAPA